MSPAGHDRAMRQRVSLRDALPGLMIWPPPFAGAAQCANFFGAEELLDDARDVVWQGIHMFAQFWDLCAL